MYSKRIDLRRLYVTEAQFGKPRLLSFKVWLPIMIITFILIVLKNKNLPSCEYNPRLVITTIKSTYYYTYVQLKRFQSRRLFTLYFFQNVSSTETRKLRFKTKIGF